MFSAEYKNSVNSVQLPADYKSKILSALREQAKQLDTDESDQTNEVITLTETPAEEQINNTQVIPFESPRKEKNESYKNFLRVLPGIAAAMVILIGALLFMNFSINTLPKTKDFNFTVASATNLSNIKGAKLTFRNSSGEVVKNEDGSPVTAFTNEKGNATVTLPASEDYTAEVSINGYIPFETAVNNQFIYVSPVMDENTYRAVLTWDKECDLDAILTVTKGEATEQLFYFSSSIKNEQGQVIAALDTDSKKADAPETITFNATENGIFRFSVASYSSLKYSDESILRNSNAQVCLYKGDSKIGEYNLSLDAQGNAWCVFEIKDSKLITVDSTYSVNAITEVR